MYYIFITPLFSFPYRYLMTTTLSRFALVAATATLCLCCVYASAKTNFGYAACDPSVVQSSGYIDIPGVSGTQKHYFYWLFGPRRWPTDGSQPPVIMWMTGGSSSFGMLAELGPCLMNETSGELHRNAYGWNDEAYLLFVDQPTGVGYSYGDKANYVHNESGVAEDMYHFLQGFARKFTSPSITGANDFFIAGESYGGHYVPSVAYRVLQGNQRGDGPVINLKGIAVGNGLTDPYTQYPSYVDIAYDWCKRSTGAPCVNATTRDEMLSMMPHCLDLIAQCNSFPDDTDASCGEANTYCRSVAAYYSATGKNNYDVRKPCVGELCYPIDHLSDFLRTADVMSALGAKPDLVWNSSSDVVSEMFAHDIHRNFNYTVPPLLAAGIRVLIYAGDCDFICNWIGNKAWVTALNWPGKAAFNAASDVEFRVGGRAAGQERKYGNFSFVRVYDAGHMVPMDQPAAALYMVSQFLHDRRLSM
ncbi:putative mitochondrial serine carboxypeptidase (CBP1) [Leptomonas pyrrhocoris]|uniref:Carboxypeptidase n=1 Tax=Leptomonas pyrrhocoris TaxID=157538 RepID=A0A0M9FYE1_LEPPY|nr:putative mitochondrial serine carboxypeptidase (CBP1) [Leptomonas pyrrhocoris]XP_015656943.1 putative mitochondrial serine carboxypeptidase (CBP1) [Leptomonas pyrrhocoris]XP_015656946.1 putative mitochondrial serine carboxypeptidase (CBP1) [Leptomonas pyrrhocoris]KPA78503.1 putative mitochondrial serine carboxypeptidase (CBP1) [Leptomonas pyrrhocoris]KPA78504.1 putative mitochondrial serine carboxypeptidase (CBP1) [Leptomonas pyrrhocoris]KPA78507.1 putative mitochondrial serine carboxypepti|eukprot:XP_015656942.1 putative mitochondrial serine carboxypeptidase (CBP1) [Leptomonas pyrrhocoris]